MSAWDGYVNSMHAHGAEMAGVFSQTGDCWGKYLMDGVTKEEVETLANNIRTGKMEMTLMGKKCIVTEIEMGEHMTGKSIGAPVAGGASPLWHAVLGKSCVYIAAATGAKERSIVDILTKHFSNLKGV